MKQAPEQLDEIAHAKWTEVFPILEKRGDLDQGTLDALSCYCQAWSRWTQAEAKVSELGAVVKSPAGFAVPNPFVAIAASSQRQLRQWASELKLTPKTRAKAKKAEEAEGAGGVLRFLKCNVG